jgi:molecular chaperone GrpE
MDKDLTDQMENNAFQNTEGDTQALPVEEKTTEERLFEEVLQRQEEARKNYDLYLRALAEVENIKKRSQRDREEYLKYSGTTFIKKLLPIIDDLHRAWEVSGTTKDFDALSKGIEMTVRSLDELLKGEGVKAIDSVGQPFDPQYHQALSVEPSEEHPENTVIEQLQTGYILHDRVIRPSLVKVSS